MEQYSHNVLFSNKKKFDFITLEFERISKIGQKIPREPIHHCLLWFKLAFYRSESEKASQLRS